MEALLARHEEQISGVISCFDRVVIMGSLPDICYPEGMAAHLSAHSVRLFDFTKWAEPLRNQIRANAEAVATQEGLEIDFIRRKNFRKEERIKDIVAARGDHPGLVHIFSAMEPCTAFRPWHDKQTHQTILKTRQGQCLHYYFYFIDILHREGSRALLSARADLGALPVTVLLQRTQLAGPPPREAGDRLHPARLYPRGPSSGSRTTTRRNGSPTAST